ncbi:hypothetical protein FKP32DRAFT_1603269 [Trametes sanguinea]|nr:hypothetical protein FKP32DRAFT_1603269 [Trametes sanguinea]
MSWARVVLLLNRYVSLLYFLLSLAPLLPEVNMLSNAVTICVIAFSGLRIYAISTNNRLVTGVVVLLALVPVGTNLYLEGMSFVQYTEDYGCTVATNLTPLTFHNLTILTRACLIASEALVIVVTWMKTCCLVHSRSLPLSPGGTPMTFTRLVLREGIVYFCVVLSLNIVQLVFTFLEGNTLSLVVQILDVLTPILISRFYFDLGELKEQEATSSLPSIRSTTTLRFASEYTGSADGDEGSLSDIIFNDEVDSPPANACWSAKEVVYA